MACSRFRNRLAGLLLSVWVLLLPGLLAAAEPFSLTLAPDSSHESGCFPPCLCPIRLTEGVSGELVFELAETNPLFATYSVTADLIVPGEPPISLRGAGTYKVGGEVLLIQEMVLDLAADGGPAEGYQSGSVPGGGDFPDALSISVSIGQRECFDTVLNLRAGPGKPESGGFVRGDCNADGPIDISDAVTGLTFLFGGGERPPCASACDANDDGKLDISDPITTLSYLFLGGDPLPQPAGACGPDPTGDELTCDRFPPCFGSCDREIEAIAAETQIVGSCSAVVRLDYLTRRLLGWQLICGKYAQVTEEAAREQAKGDTGFGGGQMLNAPAPPDVYVFYEAPGDFGGASVVSARTGLSLFGGGIVWLGTGEITYPHSWRDAGSLGSCSRFAGELAVAGYDLAAGSAGLPPADLEATLEVVRRTAIFEGMARSGYVFDAAVILYPRSVGAFNPLTAEWIVVVNGGWLE